MFSGLHGAEHLVSDKQRVKAYLDEELSTTTLDDQMPWEYEPCGIDSNYYRVSIRTIKESVISKDLLLDAFIRSARSAEGRLQGKNSKKRPTVESWRDRWQVMIVERGIFERELKPLIEHKYLHSSLTETQPYPSSRSHR
ncbi:MAG: hypothetical protein IJ618_06470 [Prevotella sp.]|nr:hypothetical protein [Prevotella sp.]